MTAASTTTDSSSIMITSSATTTEDAPTTTAVNNSNNNSNNSSNSSSSSLKAKVDKETSKARRDAFSRLRTLSNSFSKQHRCSHTRRVRFDLTTESTVIHQLPANVDRTLMFMNYQDKVSTADDVEETCYQYNDSDFVHPYVLHLRQIWEKCGSSTVVGEVSNKSGNPTSAGLLSSSSSSSSSRGRGGGGEAGTEGGEGSGSSHKHNHNHNNGVFTSDDLNKLTNTRGRGLEKKLLSEIKRQRDSIYKQVLETQKSYSALPYGARSKMIKNKYKKLTLQSKIFALTMAMGDAQFLSQSSQQQVNHQQGGGNSSTNKNNNKASNTVAATSA